MIAQSAVPSRYHALDALRAAMMFLGIYLHASWPIRPSADGPSSRRSSRRRSIFRSALIHIFRMPVFYVMAGFFAALLLQRYGFRRAVDNRFWRIVVPFVVGWIILFPLVMFLAAFGRRGLDRALDFILSGRFLAYAHPLHLWFLEYLIVLYLLAVVAVVGVRFLLPPRCSRPAAPALPRRPCSRCGRRCIFAVPSFLAMLLMKHPWLEDPPSFVPVARIVVAYAIPFGLAGCFTSTPTCSRRSAGAPGSMRPARRSRASPISPPLRFPWSADTAFYVAPRRAFAWRYGC